MINLSLEEYFRVYNTLTPVMIEKLFTLYEDIVEDGLYTDLVCGKVSDLEFDIEILEDKLIDANLEVVRLRAKIKALENK